VDIVPAARTVLVVTDPAVTSLTAVEQAVRTASPRRDRQGTGDLVEVPVDYDGEDLDEVASLLGCTTAEVVHRHTHQEWTVAFYRADDPEAWLVQMKFGPSAWLANTNDPYWTTKVPAAGADYTRLFLTHGKTIRQSSVTLAEVLAGLKCDDFRLRDEMMALIIG